MPVRKVRVKRRGRYRICFRWGKTGKIYCGRGAHEKVARQGRAIHARRK